MSALRSGALRAVPLAAVAVLLAACGEDPRVVLACPGAAARTVRVELATTAEARRVGLRGRTGLAPGTGLLLVFAAEGDVCITAAGVAFPTQVLFARAGGEVTATEPFAADDGRIVCAPARVVLEVEPTTLAVPPTPACTLAYRDIPLPEL
ncbi:MAG: DUF192 domain-containing protein [Myxococcota bacterium]